MDWSNAGKRTKLGIFDGSVLAPVAMCFVVFHWVTISILLCYAGVNAYLIYKGRSMIWMIRWFRFYLRGGVVLARPASYWRRLIG